MTHQKSWDLLDDMARALGVRPTWVYLAALGAILLIGLVLGLILRRVFGRIAARAQSTAVQLIFVALERLALPLLFLAALYTGLENLKLPQAYEHFGSKLIFILVVVVIFYFLAKVISVFLRRSVEREPSLERIAQPTELLVRVLFALLALIIILENLNVSLKAVWTTLGVGSVAIALALQETLSNFFAGVNILASRPVNPGDYIKLDTGTEGFVVRVGWRVTVLRTTSNNTVFIPNSVLAKSIVTNYSLPERRLAASLPIRVVFGTDPGRVERILLEEAKKAAPEVEGLVSEPPASVVLAPGSGDAWLEFSLTVQVRQFTDQGRVLGELRKRILERLQAEGIQLPLPAPQILLGTVPLASGTEPRK